MRHVVILVLTLQLVACANSNVMPRDGDGGSGDASESVDASGADAESTDAAPIDAGPPRSCTEGCDVLQRCVGGVCVPYPACSGEGRCAPDEICQRRMCLPSDEDLDGDGFVARDDCDEGDAMVYPGSPEVCNNIDDDCDSSIDEAVTRPCASVCETGVETCTAGTFGTCSAAPPELEDCNGIDDDCDGSIDESLSQACSTACGSGTETCSSGAWIACDAPPVITETCNLVDDDCNGTCDDASGGCRHPVHRSLDSTRGEHFYTRSRSEAACCGFTVEAYDFFWLYSASNAGVQPLYRCLLASGFHFYTRSSTCEGSPGATNESILGYVARSAGACGSVPLYRLVSGSDHFYTPSAGERDSAVSIGYTFEGIEGYVWTSP